MEKRFGLMLGFLLAFVVLMSFASATLTTSAITNLNNTAGAHTFKFNVTSNVNETANVSFSDLTQGTQTISFTATPSSFDLNTVNDTKEITVNYNVPTTFNFELGMSYSTTLSVKGNSSTAISKTVNFQEPDYCSGVANPGNLKINGMDFTVEKGFGTDNDYWYLLDNISVDVEVKNTGSWDMRNVKVEWELVTTAGDKITDGDVSDFRLDRGDDNTVTISFKLDENMKRFEGEDAVFYVKATGEIDDNKAGVYDRTDSCGFDDLTNFQTKDREIPVRTSDDFMIVDDVSLNGNHLERNEILQDPFTCASTVDVAGTVYNLGDYKQKDAYVEIYNTELGIGKKIDLSDISGFDSQNLNFQFDIPKTAQEKTYNIKFEVHDKDGDIFQNQEDDDAITSALFKVQGNCKIADPSVSVALDSEKAVSGRDMIVKVHLRNEDPKNATFTVNADGFSSWATLKTVDPENFILKAGETKDVYLTFALKSSSAGERQFNLLVTGNGDLLANKPVLVTVEEGSVFGNLFDGFDWKIWGIIILNLILLVAIIIVARRVLRRR